MRYNFYCPKHLYIWQHSWREVWSNHKLHHYLQGIIREASPMAHQVKNLPAMQKTQEMWVWSLGLEDPLEEEMATHPNSCLGNSMDRGTWQGKSPWGHKRVKQNWSWARRGQTIHLEQDHICLWDFSVDCHLLVLKPHLWETCFSYYSESNKTSVVGPWWCTGNSSGLKSQSCLCRALWPWTNHEISLGFHFSKWKLKV